MLYCTHVLLSAIGGNICNAAQVIKSQIAFLFFLQNSYRGALKKRECIYINNKEQERSDRNTYVFSAPLYPQLQEIQSSPLLIHSQFVPLSPPSSTTQHLPFLTWIPVTTGSNKSGPSSDFIWPADLKFSVWSPLGPQRETVGCEHTCEHSTLVSLYAVLITSCLTASLQRLHKLFTVRGTLTGWACLSTQDLSML